MTRHRFGEAWEAGNITRMADTFAPNAVLHSPVGDGGFVGLAAITELLQVVLASTSETEILREWSDSETCMLTFRSMFSNTPVQGVVELELDTHGRITQLWMYVRPLTAVVAVAEVIGTGIVGLRSHALGVGARILIKPLAGMATLTNAAGIRTYDWINRTADSRT